MIDFDSDRDPLRGEVEQLLNTGLTEGSHGSRLRHDLRNALNLVMGFADLLAADTTGTLNEKQRLYLDNIRIGTRQMLDLITSGYNSKENTHLSGPLNTQDRG